MNVKRYISAAAAIVSVAAVAVAQEPLNKEITVDKEIVPQEREAQRLQLTPKIVRPEVQYKKLAWSSRAVPAEPVNGVRLLPPAPWEASVESDPYRGYVAGGYMPLAQFCLAAGYRLLDTEETVANVALQYSGLNYKGTPRLLNGDKIKLDYKRHSFAAGANIEHEIEKDMFLGADLDYTFLSANRPTIDSRQVMQLPFIDGRTEIEFHETENYWSGDCRDFHLVRGGAHFDHRVGAFDYGLYGRLEYAGYPGKGSSFDSNSFQAGAGLKLGYAVNRSSKFAFTLDYKNVGSHNNWSWYKEKTDYGVLDAMLVYNLTKDSYALTAGAHLTSRSGDDSGVLIYPEFKLSVMPTQQFSAYVNIGGGNVVLNSMGSMLRQIPYLEPSQLFTPTYSKWQGNAGINLGPFSGLTLELWGGYSDMRNVWLPWSWVWCENNLETASYPEGAGIFPGGMNCIGKYTNIHYGAAVGYKYGSKVVFRLSYEGAPDGDDKGYAQWLDRATSEIKAHMEVKPIEKLSVNVDFSCRNGRKYEMGYITSMLIKDGYNEDYFVAKGFVSLGKAASLDLGASYKLNKRVTLWANVENVLNRRWQLAYGIMNPGVTGLVGATYKF